MAAWKLVTVEHGSPCSSGFILEGDPEDANMVGVRDVWLLTCFVALFLLDLTLGEIGGHCDEGDEVFPRGKSVHAVEVINETSGIRNAMNRAWGLSSGQGHVERVGPRKAKAKLERDIAPTRGIYPRGSDPVCNEAMRLKGRIRTTVEKSMPANCSIDNSLRPLLTLLSPTTPSFDGKCNSSLSDPTRS